MARSFVNASSELLSLGSAIVSGAPFSGAAWIYPTSTPGGANAIFSVTQSTANHYFQVLHISTDALRFTARDGGTEANATTGNTLTLNTWCHCAFSADSATSRTIWLDGDNANAGTNTTSRSPSSLNVTGVGYAAPGPFAKYMDGYISEMVIWNEAMTAAEAAILATGVSPLAIKDRSKIVARWSLTGSNLTSDQGHVLSATGTSVVSDSGKIFFMPRPRARVLVSGTAFTSAFASTLDDVTMAASAALEFPGAFSSTLDDVIMAATGAADFVGAFASTLDNVSMAASAALEFASTFASTLDDVVMAAVGSSGIDGTFASTLDDVTMAASAALEFPSIFASTLDDVVMAAAGAAPFIGTSAVTLEDVTMSAAGTVTNISTGTARGRLRWRKVWLEGEKVKLGDLHKNEAAVSEFALEAINVGGLARKMALPYIGKSRTKTIENLSNNAKELKVLIKLYERERREREREEELLLL